MPQARVSPAPRSHTRRRICAGPVDVATLTLTRSGNSGSCLDHRARAGRVGTASQSGTKNTTCGLPTLTATGLSRLFPADRHRQRVHRIGERDRLPLEARRAHVDRDAVPGWARLRSCRRASRSAPARRAACATARVALPQASTSPPSALKMRMRKSAARGGFEQDQLVAADPGRAGRPARAASAARRSAAAASARASSTTKSLPRPCILMKGTRIARALYAGAAASRPVASAGLARPLGVGHRLARRRAEVSALVPVVDASRPAAASRSRTAAALSGRP